MWLQPIPRKQIKRPHIRKVLLVPIQAVPAVLQIQAALVVHQVQVRNLTPDWIMEMVDNQVYPVVLLIHDSLIVWVKVENCSLLKERKYEL